MTALHNHFPQQVFNPVLAIHGSAGNGRQWKKLNQYCHPSCGLHLPDIGGYSDSDLVNTVSIPSFEDRLLPLNNWFDQLEKPAHIIAHSFGCTLAAELMLEYQEKIASVSFYEPVIPVLLTLSESDSDMRLLETLKTLWKAIRDSGTGKEIKHFIDFWAGSTVWEKLSSERKQKLCSLAKPTAADFEQALSLTKDRYLKLPKTIPTQIITGSVSPKVSHRISEIASQLLKADQMYLIESIGHMGPFSHPELVFPKIMSHINNVESQLLNN